MVGGPAGAAVGGSLGLGVGGAADSVINKPKVPDISHDIPIPPPLPQDPAQSEEAKRAVSAARRRALESGQERTQTNFTGALGAPGTPATLKQTLGGS